MGTPAQDDLLQRQLDAQVKRAALGVSPTPDVQSIRANGTWNRPPGNYTLARIVVTGLGGPGGGGPILPGSTNGSGGAPGGAAAEVDVTIPFSMLPAQVPCIVPAAPTGGVGATTVASGGSGTGGAPVEFGLSTDLYYVKAYSGGRGAGGGNGFAAGGGGGAGLGGNGGAAAGATPGTAGTGGGGAGNALSASFGCGPGAPNSTLGNGGAGGNPGNGGPASGGAGAGILNTNAVFNGGAGGIPYAYSGPAQTTNPGSAPALPDAMRSGAGGGGGGSKIVGQGGDGADGQFPGGGGGGGGATQDTGARGGNGGKGGGGQILVTCS